jgi:hypothetical protein
MVPGFLPPAEAVGKMVTAVDALTLKDNGRFVQTRTNRVGPAALA